MSDTKKAFNKYFSVKEEWICSSQMGSLFNSQLFKLLKLFGASAEINKCLGIYPKYLKAGSRRDISIPMFMAA